MSDNVLFDTAPVSPYIVNVGECMLTNLTAWTGLGTTGCSVKNIRFIFSQFLTQMLTNFNDSFTAAFSDELLKSWIIPAFLQFK